MPWTVKDVERHKKGLTPAQKRKWVSIANSVYKDCMKTGTDKTCAAKAIRIANSKFMEEGAMKKQRIPNGALRLVAPDCHAFALEDEGKKKLQLVVYSGGVIKGHWWWGNLAIDLEGVKFDRNKYPVLENHNTARKLAFSKRPIVDGSISLDPDTTVFVDTDESREFQKLSSEGFPYQASMYAIPSSVERVAEGETADVNGFKFKGPGSIWRKCLYQEASACVFGWDKNTEAKAFSKTEEVELEYEEIGKEVVKQEQLKLIPDNENELTGKEVKDMPITLEQLTADAPDLLKKIQEDATAEAEKKFQKERDGFKAEREKFQGEIDTLTSDNAGMADRVSKLEKNEAKREQREQNNVADAIWRAQLDASDLPPKRFAKIKQHVKAKDYLGEDGLLDREKFSEAVAAEIKDWEVDETSDTDVLGVGAGHREVDPDAQKKEKLDADNKSRANALLKIAGQDQKEAA